MSFINAAMALGATAFVVPLAIHLLFRSRFKSLDWGAMFLLQDVVNATRRRMQWHQWILLALRCAIPVLLALAMARPLISSIGGQSIAGTSPVSLILLIDDSRSMSAGTRSARTMESVSRLLDSMSRRDEVMLIRSTALASRPSSGSPRDAREKLQDLDFDGAPMQLLATLQAGVDACRDAAHPFRRVVLVSDFQENLFQQSGAADADPVLKSINSVSERLAGLEPRPSFDLLDIAKSDYDAGTLANVVVAAIRADAPAILVGQPAPLIATIRNDSELPVTNLRAAWIVNGRTVETQSISIKPWETATMNWETTFENPGGVSVGVLVEHADAIAADNRREWALNVLGPIRVWLVDGESSAEPLRGETDFLKIALSPFTFQSADRYRSAHGPAAQANVVATKDLISTQVMSEQTLVKRLVAGHSQEQRSEAVEPSQLPDLIVLANVKRPPGTAGDRDPVADYLASGGRVLFFDGDQINTSAWADCEWMPATAQNPIDASDEPFRIQPPGGKLTVWRTLGDSQDSLFDSVKISRLRAIALRDKFASVWLRADSGLPVVVSKIIAPTAESHALNTSLYGQVVQFAIPCDTAWSNLPLRPVFLPMMQQLVLAMVGSDYPGSVLPGAEMVIAPQRGTEDDAVWQVFMPDGRTRTLPDSARAPLMFRDTEKVGAYQFRAVDAGGKILNVEGANRQHNHPVRVVDVPAAESELRRVTPQLLDEFAERLGADRYVDAEALVAAGERARFGMEVWRPLLWLLLAVLIGEVLWQQYGITHSASPLARARAAVIS